MQISGWVRDDVNCSCTADEVRVCMIPGVDILLGCELSLFTTPFFFSSVVPSVFSPINGRAVAKISHQLVKCSSRAAHWHRRDIRFQ